MKFDVNRFLSIVPYTMYQFGTWHSTSLSLQAFSNEIQFSCKNLTNQISQNSRLN